MSNAPPGEIYVSEVVRQQAGNAFQWERLEDLRVKGKAKPVKASALKGAATRRLAPPAALPPRPLRAARCGDALAAAMDASREGRGNVVGIAAEAGMGKSRLVAEFVRTVRAEGGLVAYGECPTFGDSSYAVWCEVWRTLLGIGDSEPDEVQLAMLEAWLGAVDESLPAARRCSSRSSTVDPRHRSHEHARPQAAQGVAQELADDGACRLVRRPNRSSSCSRTATGSTGLSRDLLEVLVHAAAPCPCCSSSPTGRLLTPVAASASPACRTSPSWRWTSWRPRTPSC